MKTYHFCLAFTIFFLLSLSANAQFYPVLSTERIYTPWDMDTTLKTHSFPKIISLTEDGRLGIFSLDTSDNISRFYFYDDTQKQWTTKELVTDRKSKYSYNVNYNFGMKEVLNYENLTDDNNNKKYAKVKWIINYGDSVFKDSIPYSSDVILKFSSPSVYYSSVFVDMGEKRDREYQTGYIRSNNAHLYRMPNPGMQFSLLDLIGGAKGIPEYSIHYSNSMNVIPIDSENIIVSVRRHSKMVDPGPYSFAEIYNLLIKNNGEPYFSTYKKITEYVEVIPRQNIDKQFFIKINWSTKLYSSPRHGITPDNPIDFGFIDKPLGDITVSSEYANGTKEYYCLCNSFTDSLEKNKFLIYSIRNQGQLQKFIIPDSIFRYSDEQTNTPSIYSKQIIYANDSILYLSVTTNGAYQSIPQIYKIHLNKIATSISEQDASLSVVHPYPNPADETIKWFAQDGIASITDALGRKLIEAPASAMETDVSGLPAGVYFLTIQNGVMSSTNSFVVAR